MRLASCIACLALIGFGCLGSDPIGGGGQSFGGEAPWHPPVGGSYEGGGELTPDGGSYGDGGYASGNGGAGPVGGSPSQGGSPPNAVCGDGSCDAGEDCDSCSEDCGVCGCMPDALEPNAGSGSASPTSLGVDYCGLSVCAGDFDWFEFDVGSSFTATITFFHAEGDLDLEIYSAQTNNYVNGSYSANDDETVTLNVSPGTYWARVYGDLGAENPDYCFRVD